MLVALVVAPLLFALVALAIPSSRSRPLVLPPAAAVHLALTVRVLSSPTPVAWSGWLALDPLARVVLALVSSLFLVCSIYAVGYLHLRSDHENRIFCACLLALQGMMTLIVLAHHLGLMWVALEACTLASAPLLYFRRGTRSLEALWKYLLIGSVGIAIALLGSLFLAYSMLRAGLAPSLLLEDLVTSAPQLSRPWLHSAFVLLFIGYGTKMGLAPMHTWKPDAYGQASGLAGTMLAGGVTSCAFLAILRFYKIVGAAGEGAFAREIMVAVGLFSMAVAGVFMARQKDFKRMLAYSSVEHMGILVLGVGIGGVACFGALLHMLNNALTKGVLFLAAGNIHRVYASKKTDEVSGALRRLPASGGLLLLGFFAVTGSPPFGPFFSEFTILRGAIGLGRFGVAALFLALLVVVFLGMGSTVLAVVQGEPSERAAKHGGGDTFLTVAPVVVFALAVLVLGLYLPGSLERLLLDAARWVEPA